MTLVSFITDSSSGRPDLPPLLRTTANTELTLKEQLLLRETQLSQAQQMAGMASWEWYFGSTTINWSPEMYAFWGYTPGEVSVDLDSVAQSTHADDLPILQSAVAQLLRGEDVEMEYRRYDRLRREVYIHTIGRVIRNEAGEAIGVFGIDMDITRRKQEEQHLLDLNRQLADKNRALEQLLAEADAFTYAASHDLQEPLRKIRSFSQLILEQEAGQLSAQGQEFFRRSVAAAGRMQQLIQDLIAYSHVNAADRALEPVDLTQLVAQVQQNQSDLILTKQATIQVGTLPVVPVISFAFEQLLDNLIGNALKYHLPDQPPVITIRYERLSDLATVDQHQLTVADQGIGFDPLYRDRIFQLFQRLHNQQQYAGTGIGLAICQRVMQNHGGTIEAVGQPGEGATFILRWPVSEPA